MLQIIMTEGKKRQIRHVAAQLGYPVRQLTRTHIGQLALGDMKAGEWRELNQSEVDAMRTPDPAIRLMRPKPRRKK